MQSVEMIPFGLLAGFVDDKEVRITEISTESFCFRVREQVERPRHIRIGSMIYLKACTGKWS